MPHATFSFTLLMWWKTHSTSACVCVCVCVYYSSYKQNTEAKHTLISRCRKSIWQNFTWIHNLKKNSSERPAASALSWESCKEHCSHPFNNKGTDWLQTHKVPGQNHRASTGLKPRVASCLQGEERCQPDSAPWATLWGWIGEGLCTDWQAGGSVTVPGRYTARGVCIFS